MNNSDEIAHLLRENVAASNRTTRAVRAFVRFLFIQLSAATFAGLVIYFGVASANVALVVVGLVIWLVGVLWSSSVGWEELDKSDPDKFENRARTASEMEEIRISEQKRIDEFNKAEATRLLILEKQQADAETEAEKRRAERRALRSALFKKPWFRISVAGGILAVAAAVILSSFISDAIRSDAEKAAIAGLLDDVKGIKVAGDACGAGSAISYSAGQAKISVLDSRDVADCVLKALSGQDVVLWDLNTGLGKIANGYEFIWRGEFLTILPQK